MWCSTRWPAEAIRSLARGLALTLGLVLAAGQALAHPELPGSRLQGEATLRYFGLRIYHARLWTLPDYRVSQPVDQPLVLELEYLRELKGPLIAERSLKEMRRGAQITDAQAERWLAEMQRIFPDVKAGDRISGQHLPGRGARFWHNERLLGQIDDAAFARLFFGIWLAPSTSEPDMRLALLGQASTGPGR